MLILLVIITLILRLIFLEKWLGDWDSIQFALGLHEYSLTEHQPHPPGYPVYILLGKFFLMIFRNDTTALTMMSAVFGSLTVIPLYLLAKEMLDQKLALLSAILFIFVPVVWLLSVSALTDAPGLFCLTLIGYLFYKFAENKKAVIFVSFLAGFLLGVRFNEIPVMVGLLIWVMVLQKNLKFSLLQFFSFILGISLWLVPMVLLTGVNEFIQTITNNGGYVVLHDALLGESHSILGLIKAKAFMIIGLFSLGFTIPLMVVFGAAFVWSLFQRKLYYEKWYQFFLVWIISYSALLLTFFNLELPRHIMPLIIPMILITVYGLGSLVKKSKLFWVLPLILIIVLAKNSYSQVFRYQKTIPPTVAPVLFVKQNFSPKDTVIFSSYTYRDFQYYGPEFINIDKNSDKSAIKKGKTVIVDHTDLKNDSALKDFEEVSTKYFSADKDIFPKVDSIELYVLKYRKD